MNEPVGSRKTLCGCGESCWATAPGCVSLKWNSCDAVLDGVRGSLKVLTAEPSLGGLLVLFCFDVVRWMLCSIALAIAILFDITG